MIISGSTTKYVQPVDSEIFHDYKNIAKRTVEYSKTHWLIPGGEDLTTTEAIVKLHYLVHNHISDLALEDMRKCVFQKVLLRIEMSSFGSVAQIYFPLIAKTCNRCHTQLFYTWCERSQ